MRIISLFLALFAFALPHIKAAQPAVNTQPAAPTIRRAVATTQAETVTIRPGDVFDMRVTGIPPDVATGDGVAALQYAIGQDGIVNIPLLGKMKIAGLTSSQAEDQIQAKYIADKIYTHPVVIISVQQAQVQRSVTITGGVRGPGKQPWASDLTLRSAIGSAAGLSDFGSPKGVRIIRDGKVFGTYDLREVNKDPSKDVKLLAGDQIIVKE